MQVIVEEIMKTKIDRGKAKKVVEETASRTVRFTIKMVKVIFIIIIIYTAVVTIYFFLKTPTPVKKLEEVATLSVAGFWAFFLGYFGWRLGQSIEVYLWDVRKKK